MLLKKFASFPVTHYARGCQRPRYPLGWPLGFIHLADCARVSGTGTIAALRWQTANSWILYRDYARSCRESGVEPLTLEALQRPIDALTETPQPTIH